MSWAAVHIWSVDQATTCHEPVCDVNTNYSMLYHLRSPGGPERLWQLELKKSLFLHLPSLISNFVAKVSITFKWAGKQALPRVTGAPSLSTNTWKYVFRSKISGLPPGPCRSFLSFGANIQTNTCTTVPSKCCTLSAERPERHAQSTCTHTCTRCAEQVQVWVFSLTYLETSMEHFLTLKTKEALAVALVIHHLFSLA